MSYLIIGLIVLELFLQVQASAAVVGSRQRYVSLSLRRMVSWVINLIFVGEGLVFLATGQTDDALWYVFCGTFGVIIELRMHRNDDDWFNGRGKKIMRGIKRRLAAPRRSPASAPSPAFG